MIKQRIKLWRMVEIEKKYIKHSCNTFVQHTIIFFIKHSIIIVTVVSVVTVATIFNHAKLNTSIIFSLSLIYYNLGKLVHLL